jgi:hypothetical protein
MCKCADQSQPCCGGEHGTCADGHVCDNTGQCQPELILGDGLLSYSSLGALFYMHVAREAGKSVDAAVDVHGVACGAMHQSICEEEPFCEANLEVKDAVCVCGGVPPWLLPCIESIVAALRLNQGPQVL